MTGLRVTAFLACVCLPALAVGALDDAERAEADALAQRVPWSTPSAAGQRPSPRSGARTAAYALGVQTLVVEDDPRKGAPVTERRARVYQHDHRTRRTRRVLLDLDRGVAVETRVLASPHLPLNEDERVWALGRLAAAAELLERLRDEQRRRGLTPFGSLDELDVKASVFEPNSTGHPCTRERCALLSLFDDTRTVFATEPLVYFASGSVDTLDASRERR